MKDLHGRGLIRMLLNWYDKPLFVILLNISKSKVSACNVCQCRNNKMVINTDELHPVPVKST